MDFGLTRKDLAAKLGVYAEAAKNWEESRTVPALKFLPAIYEFLGYCPLRPAGTRGDRLRQVREAAGLSRRELGRRVGLDEGTLLRLERGITRRPGRRTLLAVASLLAESSKTAPGC